jgi:hypothetical protein
MFHRAARRKKQKPPCGGAYHAELGDNLAIAYDKLPKERGRVSERLIEGTAEEASGLCSDPALGRVHDR